MILDDQIEFVKHQQGYHERQVARASAKGDSARLHEKLLHGFTHVLATLHAYQQAPAAAPTPVVSVSPGSNALLDTVLQNPTQVNPEVLEGLPPELLEQLSISETDRFQWQVVALINRTPDKIISIEVLLIALYRATGKVLERTELANRIYRMMRKKMVYSVNGKKGWYTTVPSDEPQLDLDADAEAADTQ